MPSDVVVKIAGDASELQETLSGLGKNVLSWIGDLNPVVAGVVAIIGGIGAAAIDIGVQFEEASKKIQVGTGAQGEALKGLEADFKAIYAGIPQDAGTAAQAIADLNTRLGLQGETLQKVATNALNVADLLGEDVAGSIKATTQAFNAFGVESDEIAGKQDYLFKVTQATGISLTDLGAQMAQAAPTAKQLGLDFDTTAALIGKLQMVGPGAGEAMAGLTKAVANLTENGIPAKDALTSIIDTIKNAPNDTVAASEAMEVFGKRAGSKLAEEIRSGQFDLEKLLQTIHDSPVTIDAADNATDNFTDKLQELWRNVQMLLEPLGTGLVNAGKAVLDWLLAAIKPTGDLTEAFGKVKESLKPLTDLFTEKFKPILIDVAALLVGLSETIGKILMPVLSAFWEIIKTIGGLLVDGLKVALGAVADGLSNFIGLLKQLPGVSSLFETGQKAINDALGDAKKKSDDAKTATDGLKTSHSQLASTLADTSKPALTNVIGALQDKKQKTEDAKKATDELKGADDLYAQLLNSLVVPAHKPLYQALRDVETARNDVRTAANNLKAAEETLKSKMDDSKTSASDLEAATDNLKTAKESAKTAANNLKDAMNDLRVSQQDATKAAKELDDQFASLQKTMHSVKTTEAPQTTEAINGILGAVQKLNAEIDETAQTKAYRAQLALKDMGIKPKEDLDALAEKSKTDFDIVTQSGTASSTEIQKAWVKMMEDRKVALKQNGFDLSQQEQRNLDDMKAKLEGKPTLADKWNDVNSAIHQSTAQLGAAMVDILFEGPGSFAEKGIAALKNIGKAVADHFVQPAMKAIGDFISTTITDLLSGKGLGGVLDSIKNIGKAISDVFGGVSGAASSAGGAAGSAGGASASAGGAAGSAGSGVAGVVGAIGSVATAVSSIIGNFQMAKQETTLNAIEHNTRYSMMFLGEQGWDSIHGNTHDSRLILDDIRGYLTGAQAGVLADAASKLFDIREGIHYDVNGRLDTLHTDLLNLSTSLLTINSTLVSDFQSVSSSLTTGFQNTQNNLMMLVNHPPPNVNVDVRLDGAQIAAFVSSRVEQQVRFALAIR